MSKNKTDGARIREARAARRCAEVCEVCGGSVTRRCVEGEACGDKEKVARRRGARSETKEEELGNERGKVLRCEAEVGRQDGSPRFFLRYR